MNFYLTSGENFISILTLIMASLSAFFTLVTGAFAIAVAYYIYRNKQLTKERESEIKQLNKLQVEAGEKVRELEKRYEEDGDSEEIKKDLKEMKNTILNLKSKTGGLVSNNFSIGGQKEIKDYVVQEPFSEDLDLMYNNLEELESGPLKNLSDILDNDEDEIV